MTSGVVDLSHVEQRSGTSGNDFLGSYIGAVAVAAGAGLVVLLAVLGLERRARRRRENERVDNIRPIDSVRLPSPQQPFDLEVHE